jgi:Domain of unknown function (DUF4112)
MKSERPITPSVTPTSRSMPADVQKTRAKLRALAWWLDSSIRLPGGFRIGADAILGLVPFLGDALGMLLSGYIVLQAARLRAPFSVLARMLLNIAIEGLVGLIPLAGDVFDAAWKANQHNLILLEGYLDHPAATAATSRRVFALLVLGWVLLLALLTALSALLFSWAWHLLRG